MKCVKSKSMGLVRRCKEKAAEEMVKTGEWRYVPKSEWKAFNPIPRKEVNV